MQTIRLREFARSAVPTPLWNAARAGYYRVKHLRFAGQWFAGLAFDLWMRDYRSEGMVFKVPRNLMKRAHRSRFYYDTHERDERDLVRKWLPPDATVLELGACIGVVSCVIGRKLAHPERHVAVEPNPELQDVLQTNRDINSAAFRIEPCLVSRSSDGRFFLNEAIVMSSANQASSREITVPVRTVEQIEQASGLQFDAVFMDIQGAEREFMAENPALLQRCKCVILEMHPHIIGKEACDECRSMMTSAGLKCVEQRGLVEVWMRA